MLDFPISLVCLIRQLLPWTLVKTPVQLLNAVRLNVLNITDVKEEPLFVRTTMTIFKNAAADTFR